MSETNKAAVSHPAVGKLHKVRNGDGQRYRVAVHFPKFDFGVRRGGRRGAFRIVREPHDTESYVGVEEFLAGHEEVAGA